LTQDAVVGEPCAACSSSHTHYRGSLCFLDDARLWCALLRS